MVLREATRARLVHGLAAAQEGVAQSTAALATRADGEGQATKALVAAERAAALVEAAGARRGPAPRCCRPARPSTPTLAEQVRSDSAVSAQRTLTQDLREVYQDRRQARLDAMAGELASQLQHAEPCPVCGSAEHPAPAPSGDLVSAEEVAAAESAWQSAVADLGAAERTSAAHVATLTQLHEQLGDDHRDRAALAAAVSEAQEALSELSRSAATLPQARAQVEAAQVALESVTAQLSALREAAATAKSRIDALDAELETERATLAAAVQEHTPPAPAPRPGRAGQALGSSRASPTPISSTRRSPTTRWQTPPHVAHATTLRELDHATRDHADVVAATIDSFQSAGFDGA